MTVKYSGANRGVEHGFNMLRMDTDAGFAGSTLSRQRHLLSSSTILAASLGIGLALAAPRPAVAEVLNLGGGDQTFSFGGTGSAWDRNFTFTAYSPTVVVVTDCCLVGDQFQVFNNGVSLGTTSVPPPVSVGTFTVSPGAADITGIAIASPYGDGGGYIRGYSLYIDPSQATFNQNDPAAQQNPMVFNGGTLKPIGGSEVTFAQPVSILATGGTVDTSSADTRFNGEVTAQGDFTKKGTGTFTVAGGAGFKDVYNTAGTFVVASEVTATGLTNSAGAHFNVVDDGSFTTGATVSNYGTIEVFDGGKFTAGGMNNAANATIKVYQGGTFNDDLDNAGTMTNAGVSNAIVATNTSTITNTGTGVWTGAVKTNQGSITNEAGASWTGAVSSNSGTIYNQGAGTEWIGAVVANSDTVRNRSGASWTGDVGVDGGAANTGHILNEGATSTWTGNVENNGIGLGIENAYSATWSGTVKNAGHIYNSTGSTWNGNVLWNDAPSGVIYNDAATWNGSVVTNTGKIYNQYDAVWSGTIQQNSGTILNQAGSTWTGAVVANSGQITNYEGTWNSGTIGAVPVNPGDPQIGNSGTIQNLGGGAWSGDVANNLAAGSILNDSLGTKWTGNVLHNAGTITNQQFATWNGKVVLNQGQIQNKSATWKGGDIEGNSALATITNTGWGASWSGAVKSNDGTIYNQDRASWTGDVAANSVGALIVNDNATWTGAVSNDGTIHNQNHAIWTGDVKKNTSNTSILNDNSTWTGNVIANTGTIWNQNTAIWNGHIVTNDGEIYNKSKSHWNGNVVSNNAAGAITNDGLETVWTGAITSNAGAVYNQNGAKWDGAVTTNSGTITNYLGAKWVNGAVGSNLTGAVITNDGAGTEWTGDITSNAGAVYNQNGAKWDGAITTNSGTITNYLGAKWVNGAVGSNLIGGVITNDGAGTEWTGDITSNAGAVYNQNGAKWDGAITTNSGTITNYLGAKWVNGAVGSNLIGAVIANDGSGTEWTGDITSNAGAVYNQNGAKWDGAITTNSGTITNYLGAKWVNGAVGSNLIGAVITNDGIGTEWTGDITSNAGAVYNQNGAKWDGAITTNSGTITNYLGAKWVNGAVGSNLIGAVITNDGAGTEWTGDITSNAGAVYNQNGAKWDGAITTNSGTIINALGAKWVNGAVGSNLIGAVITNDGLGTEWTGDITSNAGAVYNQDHATWTGDVAANSIGALIVNDNATWNGSVSNDGTIHNQNHAVWTGDVKKNTSNTSIVNDNSTWNGNVLANTGTIWNQNTAIWNGDVLTNDGHINNTLDSNWNGNVVSNNAAGVITNDGAGTEWTGAITSNAGAVYNQNGAIWHGDVTDNVGTIVTTSTWDGSITNSNYLRAEGAITKFVVNNAGATTKVAGNLDVGGNFTNAGLVDMSDGTKTYQTLKVGMNFAGTGASTVAMDIDLSSGNVSGPRADVVVAGSISGSTNLQFQSVGTKGLFGQEITVAEGASAANAFSTTTLGSNGLVDYNLKQDGSKWVVTSSLNPSAGSIAGTVAASLMTITTGFLESTSAFVSGPADPVRDQISYGLWTRVKAGSYNVDNVSTTQVVGASSAVSEAGTFKSNFNGFQVGADVSRSDMGGSGWTGHVGLTAGDVWLDNTLQNYAGVSSQVEAPFFGAYAALVGHGLFADVQVQRNIYNIDLTNTQALLMSSPTNADGWTVVASAGGVIPFAETWFVEPSVGLNYATASVDNVLLPGGSGVIKTDTIDSLIGSLRLRMGTSFTAGPNLVLRPSVQASVWHEFAGDGGGLYDDGQGGAAIIGISNIGTFGQVGVGLSAQALDTGVLGFIRADYRFGENIDGGSFTGGLRKQF